MSRRRTPHPLVAQLKAERQARGLSQEAVARRIGTTRALVSLWETGQGTPGLFNTIAYAAALDYTLTLTPKDGD